MAKLADAAPRCSDRWGRERITGRTNLCPSMRPSREGSSPSAGGSGSISEEKRSGVSHSTVAGEPDLLTRPSPQTKTATQKKPEQQHTRNPARQEPRSGSPPELRTRIPAGHHAPPGQGSGQRLENPGDAGGISKIALTHTVLHCPQVGLPPTAHQTRGDGPEERRR
jgi:hypothetical protein